MRQLNILVVDGDKSICETLCAVLREEGALVHAATSCKDATKIMQSAKPDLLILEYWFGEEACDELAALAHKLGVPVLLATGWPSADQLASRISAQAFLKKPFDIDDLMGKVSALVKISR